LNQADLNSSGYETTYPEYSVLRDEAVKIDITDALNAVALGNGSGDLTFFVKLGDLDASSGLTDDDAAFIEAKITGTVGGSLEEYKKALIPPFTASGRGWGSDSYVEMSQIGAARTYQVVSLRNKVAGVDRFDTDATNNNRVFLYLKPIGYHDITIGLAPEGAFPISAPYSTIKSTGYYGGVGRTLTAKIDRQSGTVYDIFDFVTYQHN
jgi:hypothetical protein